MWWSKRGKDGNRGEYWDTTLSFSVTMLMDYYNAYRKYKRKYRLAAGAATPVTASFRMGRTPLIVVLDLDCEQLEPVHAMFHLLQGSTADDMGCPDSMPTPRNVTHGHIKRFWSRLCRKSSGSKSTKGQFVSIPCRYDLEQKSVAIALLEYTCGLLQTYFQVSPTLDQDQLRVNGEEPLIEAHRYAAHMGCLPPSSPFTWHQDDDGGVSYNTYTVIYYLHKSTGEGEGRFRGGDFSCAFPSGVTLTCTEEDVVTKTKDTITESGEKFEVYHIKTKTGRVVVMRGDVWHIPGLIQEHCHGCRDSVVVQVKRDD